VLLLAVLAGTAVGGARMPEVGDWAEVWIDYGIGPQLEMGVVTYIDHNFMAINASRYDPETDSYDLGNVTEVNINMRYVVAWKTRPF
jgi:hypothetical protein